LGRLPTTRRAQLSGSRCLRSVRGLWLWWQRRWPGRAMLMRPSLRLSGSRRLRSVRGFWLWWQRRWPRQVPLMEP
ncbi:hypothetical protein BKH27_12105, partial [Actinomyces oris]